MQTTALSLEHLKLLGFVVPPGAEPHSCISGVKAEGTISYYGPYQKLVHEKLEGLSREIADSLIPADSILSEDFPTMIQERLLAFLLIASSDSMIHTPNNTSACWFTIRMTHPDAIFQIPRWHQDGRMFDIDPDSPGLRSKYATTLLGPTTLFLDLPNTAEMTEYLTFSDVAKPLAEANDWTRSQLSETEAENLQFRGIVAGFFAERQYKTVPIEPNQVVRFSWGHSNSPVHSEPDISGGDRVFISLLLGSEAEIKRMAQFRGTAYET